MSTEDQRVRFINTTMDFIHDLTNSLYESMMDQDFSEVERLSSSLIDILNDLKNTFKDEV
jgi:hypothetical protein